VGLSHEDADDLLQNVFLKAWQGLAGFRGESKLSTWLYKIATNETLSYLKLKRHKVMQPAGEQYDWMARQLRAAEPLDGEAIQAKLQAAMNQLPDRQRAVFQLRYFEDMTYAGMAEVLNRSEGALKASYHHAVKKLEKMLTGD